MANSTMPEARKESVEHNTDMALEPITTAAVVLRVACRSILYSRSLGCILIPNVPLDPLAWI